MATRTDWLFDDDLVEGPLGDLLCPPGTPAAGTQGFNFSLSLRRNFWPRRAS